MAMFYTRCYVALIIMKNDLEKLDDFLIELSSSNLGVRRKLVLLENYIQTLKTNVNDITIENTVTTQVNSVSLLDINDSFKSKLRFIHELNTQYEKDSDFGRNVRKFLNVT